MLRKLTTTSLVLQTLGSRAHARLLDAAGHETVARVLERDRHRCHDCGVSVPGYMEIDHIKGHKSCREHDMRAICPFCHNLRHPLWAAARKRILLLHAPDFSQDDIHRLSWTLLTHAHNSDYATERIKDDLAMRVDRARSVLACDDAESFFEAVFTTHAALGAQKAEALFLKIEQFLRFLPAIVLDEDPAPGSGVSNWRFSGFQDFTKGAAMAVKKPDSFSYSDVRKLAERAQSRQEPV